MKNLTGKILYLTKSVDEFDIAQDHIIAGFYIIVEHRKYDRSILLERPWKTGNDTRFFYQSLDEFVDISKNMVAI